MNLLSLPTEVLFLILNGFISPYWNGYKGDRKFLELRLVCKRFDAIVSNQAFQKLDHSSFVPRLNRDAAAWLVRQKLVREVENDMDCARRWRIHGRSACRLVVAYKGPNAIYRQLRKSNGVCLYQGFLCSELSVAAFSRDIATLTEALDDPRSDVNACDKHFGPPLYAAVYIGDEAITSLLLKHQADPNIRGYYGTPLTVAVRNKDKGLVWLLLQSNKIDPNMRDKKGVTALGWSCTKGYSEIVRLLLEHSDTDPNLTSHDLTPLACASRGGHEATVQYLLGREDVTVELKEKRICPLVLAAKGGHTEVLQLLLKKFPVGAANYGDRFHSLLLYATIGGCVETVQALLERPDINPNFLDERGYSALWLALNKSHRVTVHHLLQRQDLTPNIQSGSALRRAALDRDASTVDLLLGTGCADQGLLRIIPLALADKIDHVRMIEMLLAHPDIDVNEGSRSYGTPAMLASRRGYEAILRSLLKHDDLDLNIEDNRGYTALDYARRGRHENVVRLLLEHGASDKDSASLPWT